MSSPRLVVLEGLFYDQEGLIMVQQESVTVSVRELLEPLKGRKVELSLHHYPPSPPVPHAPGFGSCMWGEHCPCGHGTRPSWLFSERYRGVLESSEKGIWTVGGKELPIVTHILGHRSRLVAFAEGEVDPSASVDELLAEAGSLLGILEGLKKAVDERE